MDRRHFIRLLGLGTGALLVPEPIRKYFFFGGVKYRVRKGGISTSQIVALEMERILPKVRSLFERDDLFYAQIAKSDVNRVSSRTMRIPLEIKDPHVNLSSGLIIDIK